MTNRATVSVLVVGVLALSGCGGGGGGDDGPQLTLASITTANAPAIASSVMAASLEGGDLSSFATAGPPGAPLGLKSSRVYAKVSEIQHAEVQALLKYAQSVAQAPIGPETSPCTNGGSITLSGNIANPAALSPNDTMVFDFASCVEGDTTVKGRFSMQVTSFSGDFDSGTFSFGVTVTVTSFQLTTGGETSSVNGSVAIAISAAGTGMLTTTVTSSSIAIAEGGATHTLTGYSSVRTLTANTFTLDVSGSLTSTDFSGTVSFDTTTLLQGTDGDYAFTGQVLVTGANGATIEIVALDSTFVRIEVDTNGDGTLEATIDSTWAELTAG